MAHISLELCSFNKDLRTLRVASEAFSGGFPAEITIKSHYTGKVMGFVKDYEEAERHEWWDGEMMLYKPTEPCNVDRLVVSHEWYTNGNG